MSRRQIWIAVGCCVLGAASVSLAVTPQQINYQGELTALDGTPIDTVVDMRFAIYEMAAAGSVIWAETLATVTVTGGLFDVVLGETHPLSALIFDGSIRYLSVAVGLSGEISPRSQLVSVPYAFRAQNADTAGHALFADSTSAQGWLGGTPGRVVLETMTDSVGIGTSVPLAKLDVAGDFRATGRAVIGPGHIVSGVNPFVAGSGNTTIGDYTTVSGGSANTAWGTGSTVGGGSRNTAGGDYSVVAGGGGVAAADSNSAFGTASTVSGGFRQFALGDFSTIGGGFHNYAYGISSTVAGGGFLADSNMAQGDFSTIGGGFGNLASYHASTIAGGGRNKTAGNYSSIAGGFDNVASDTGASVGGGWGNKARGIYSAIGGGGGSSLADSNSAVGAYSVVPGGRGNHAVGDYSFAAGRRANAVHEGAFVWSDGGDYDFTSAKPNEFAVQAAGGLRVIAEDYEYGLMLRNNDTGDGMRLYANVSRGNIWGALFASNNGTSPTVSVLGGLGLAGFFDGDMLVTGTLSKGAGAFKIDHPLDPENKYLVHSFVESPDMMNVYNGNVILDANGEAAVPLPDYFEALNRDFRYQLTCIGGFAPVYIAEKVESGRFRIAGGTPGLEVSWQVTGIRKDAYAKANRLQVVQDKPLEERGRYLHPEAFGLSRERGIGYDQRSIKQATTDAAAR